MATVRTNRLGEGMKMADATAEFFEDLARRGHEPLLEKSRGTILFELTNGEQTERWCVSVDKGNVAVTRRRTRAECTVRVPKRLFQDIVSGRENALAALLRGAADIEGEPNLLVRFQRLLPGPPRGDVSRTRRRATKR